MTFLSFLPAGACSGNTNDSLGEIPRTPISLDHSYTISEANTNDDTTRHSSSNDNSNGIEHSSGRYNTFIIVIRFIYFSKYSKLVLRVIQKANSAG